MPEAEKQEVLQFLKGLMDIQRRYANELRNAKTNRQQDVRDLLDKHIATEGISDAD
jgi:hypothetical protein